MITEIFLWYTIKCIACPNNRPVRHQTLMQRLVVLLLPPEKTHSCHSANATEEGVKMFYDKLRESKDVAATVLQKNVYENYNEFVTISKEISNILY